MLFCRHTCMSSHSRRAHCCILAVYMQLPGPALTSPPPPTDTPASSGGPAALCPFHICTFRRPTRVSSPSRRAHCCVPHCMPAAPRACSYDQPPPPAYTIQAGPQPDFHSVYTHSAGPLACSHSRWARRCIPTAVCMHLHGPARTFHLPTPTIPAGPRGAGPT